VTVQPATPVGSPLSAAILARELAELERIAELLRRRAKLRSEIEALGVAWSPIAVRPSEIIDLVAAKHGVSAKEIIGKSRRAPMVEARQEAMWLLREQRKADGNYRFSSPRIGQILGGRDHTTILWGIARHAARIKALGVRAASPAERLARPRDDQEKDALEPTPTQMTGRVG